MRWTASVIAWSTSPMAPAIPHMSELLLVELEAAIRIARRGYPRGAFCGNPGTARRVEGGDSSRFLLALPVAGRVNTLRGCTPGVSKSKTRVRFGKLWVDSLTMAEALDEIEALVVAGPGWLGLYAERRSRRQRGDESVVPCCIRGGESQSGGRSAFGLDLAALGSTAPGKSFRFRPPPSVDRAGSNTALEGSTCSVAERELLKRRRRS